MVHHAGDVELDALRTSRMDRALGRGRSARPRHAGCVGVVSPVSTEGFINRSIAACFIGSLLLIGCATHTRTATPVALNITSDTANDRFVSEVRKITLQAIAAQVPNAPPLTIAIKLDVVTQALVAPAISSSQQANPQRSVPTLSSDPMSEGAPPTVPTNGSVFTTNTRDEIVDYRVSYTIKDASGRVLESNQLTLDRGRLINMATGSPATGLYMKDPFSVRAEIVSNTAGFLASRVKTLSQ